MSMIFPIPARWGSNVSLTCPRSHPSFAISHHDSAPHVLVVCEHASSYIPPEYDQLGLSDHAAKSHVAWDPGALPVAQRVAAGLDAACVYGTMSRLLYDCNRPPESSSAIPVRSEVFDIPGNTNLSQAERDLRIANIYATFSKALSEEISRHRATLRLMVTIHSFTPVFNGVTREVEIGILHGKDAQFAQAMMHAKPHNTPYCIRLNEPYAAVDGVAHTLDTQGAANALPNVMIEVRNDLIATDKDQNTMATYLTDWVKRTLDQFPQHEDAA